MRSLFEYWTGSAWTTETQRVRCTITDKLFYPKVCEVTIANPQSNRENVYTRFQRVRVTEYNTDRIIFYGKIELVEPDFDASYGQVIKIFARDNLQEALRKTNRTNYAGFTARSTLISQIISDYIYLSPSITNISTADSQKFEVSAIAEPANQLNVNYAGSGKTVLRSISEIATTDPWDNPATGFGYIFYLDEEFNVNTPTPDLHYYRRGNRPSGGPTTRGLIIQFGLAAETATSRSMLPDYKFDIEAREMVTVVRIEYFTTEGASSSITVQLLNVGALVGGWTVGNTLTGGTSAVTATVEYIGSGFLLVSGWSGLFTNGEVLTSSAGGTTTLTNVPRQEIEQDIEFVLRGYNITAIGEARDKAAEILYHGGASPFRGFFKVTRWPYVSTTGTHDAAFSNTVLSSATGDFLNWGIRNGDIVTNTTNSINGTITGVTATTITVAAGGMSWDTGDAYRIYVMSHSGHTIRVVNTNVPTLPQDMLVTQIRYDEGPAAIWSEIEVLGTARGVEAPRHAFQQVEEEKADTALWQTQAATGGVARIAQVTNLNFQFTTPNQTNVAWIAGTATFSDNTTQTINSNFQLNSGVVTASPFVIPDASMYYIYIRTGNSSLQITNSFSNTVGITNSIIAICMRGANVDEVARIVSLNSGSPEIFAGRIIANELSAISANMGMLTAGEIRVGTGTLGVNFVGHRIYLSGGVGVIEGRNENVSAVARWQANTVGQLTAGSGTVVLDEVGILVRSAAGPTARLTFRDSGGANDATILIDGVGDFRVNSSNGFTLTSISGAAEGMTLMRSGDTVALPADLNFSGRVISDFAPSGVRNLGISTAAWTNTYSQSLLRQAASGVGGAIGASGLGYSDAFIDSLFRATASGGGQIGTATEYFGTIYVGQTRNRITGSAGDMDFYVDDGASGATLAMTLTNGATPRLITFSPAIFTATSAMEFIDIPAGSPNIRINATTDTPVSNPATDAPAGWMEIVAGGATRYIPFYT